MWCVFIWNWMYVIYFQNKNPYGQITDNQLMYQLAKNVDFRPPILEAQIPPTEQLFVDLMKECWQTNPNSRPSLEQINRKISKNKFTSIMNLIKYFLL